MKSLIIGGSSKRLQRRGVLGLCQDPDHHAGHILLSQPGVIAVDEKICGAFKRGEKNN